jgi:hypothetical protein
VKTPPAAGESFVPCSYHPEKEIYKENIMKLATKSIRVLLIVLNIFLALTAFGGGIQLLVGFYVPPVERLNGIFKDFTIPGLVLGIIVGGSALSAAILVIRKNKFSILASIAAGLVIMFFEFVEALIIGSPAGPARFMQILYFGMGTTIASIALGQWFFELLATSSTQQTAK